MVTKQNIFFVSGIGTDVGKTIASAIITEALAANYWKPIQAGWIDGTDAQLISMLVTNLQSVIYPETYRLETSVSPHIAARNENISIEASLLMNQLDKIQAESTDRPLIIEGAGGLLVPLSENLFVADLVKSMQAKMILVSRNYLGSINHSLLTAAYCKSHELDVAGWLFNDDYLSYEDEIVSWSGYPSLGSIPHLPVINQKSIHDQAMRLQLSLRSILK